MRIETFALTYVGHLAMPMSSMMFKVQVRLTVGVRVWGAW